MKAVTRAVAPAPAKKRKAPAARRPRSAAQVAATEASKAAAAARRAVAKRVKDAARGVPAPAPKRKPRKRASAPAARPAQRERGPLSAADALTFYRSHSVPAVIEAVRAGIIRLADVPERSRERVRRSLGL